MNVTVFTLPLLQAISDWQRGGSHDQKVRRGQRLKALAAELPQRFRACKVQCFRQEAHEKSRIWQLLADNHLPETIAAWTTDLTIAQSFKGGVPPQGLQGVIFRIKPPEGSMVINLEALHSDAEFLAAAEAHKADIEGYHDGIGRWAGSQQEVVLELGNLDQASIHSYGGYAGGRDELVRLYLQREPTPDDLAEFGRLAQAAGVTAGGAWWLTPSGTQAVLVRMQPHIQRLRQKKAQDAAS